MHRLSYKYEISYVFVNLLRNSITYRHLHIDTFVGHWSYISRTFMQVCQSAALLTQLHS